LKVPFQSAKTSVIATLLQHHHLSRLELSELTGVSPAGITEVTQKLLQHGLLIETPSAALEKRRGRRAVRLSMQPGPLLLCRDQSGGRRDIAGHH
jgi:DNA-binding MarR family transcriptional regulator